jgi:hypothetical protein
MQIQEARTELAGRIFTPAASAIALPGTRITRRRRGRLQEKITPSIESPLRISIHPRPLPSSTKESIVLVSFQIKIKRLRSKVRGMKISKE